MAASNGKKPIADVAKPGDSPADATARPIITGHEIMKDPMVTEQVDVSEQASIEKSAASNEQKELTPPSVTHKVIAPLSSKKDTAKAPEPQEKAPDEPTSDDAVVDAVLEKVDDKKIEDWRNEEDRKRQELVDELVEQKKYFLPINQVRSRRNSKIFLIILAVVLPVGVGLLLAIDAGIILPNVKLPFDLIK